MACVEQVRMVVPVVLVRVTVGGVMFWVMAMDSVSVRPSAEVAVTVYWPGEVTVRVAEVPTTLVPSDQL